MIHNSGWKYSLKGAMRGGIDNNIRRRLAKLFPYFANLAEQEIREASILSHIPLGQSLEVDSSFLTGVKLSTNASQSEEKSRICFSTKA